MREMAKASSSSSKSNKKAVEVEWIHEPTIW